MKETQYNTAITLELRRLEELSEALSVSPWWLKIKGDIAGKLLRSTGLEGVLRVPELFSRNAPAAWKALVTIEKLKKAGWAHVNAQTTQLYPDEPKFFRAMVINSNRDGFSGFGADFFSKDAALWASVGEAVERNALGSYSPQAYIDAPYSAMRGKAIDLYSLSGVDPEDRKKTPHLQFSDDSVFRWVEGRSLVSKKRISVPLQLASFKAHEALKRKREPLLRKLVSTGAAAHTDPAAAMLRGALELIERDAFMITWMNRLAPDQIDLESIPDARVQEILAVLKRYRLSARLFRLPTDFSVHAVLAVLIDDTGVGPYLGMGGSAGFDLSRAIEKALSEAQACRLHARRILDAEGSRTAFDDLSKIGMKERALYAARPEYADEMSFLLKGRVLEFGSFPEYPERNASPAGQLNALAEQFAQKHMELVSVPLLTKTQEKMFEFFAVMMVAPELQPMHLEEWLPYNWGNRLDEVPALLGLPVLREKNKIPHPFP